MRPRPSSRGMRMSDSTRSGIWSTAHWPSHSSAPRRRRWPPTTRRSSCRLSRPRGLRTSCWSRRGDLDGLLMRGQAGQAGSGSSGAVEFDAGSQGWCAPRASGQPSSLMRSAMPVRPLPARPGSQRGTAAIIVDADGHQVAFSTQAHLHPRGTGMADRVGDRLPAHSAAGPGRHGARGRARRRRGRARCGC